MILAIAVIFFVTVAHAQLGALDKVRFAAGAAGFDVSKLNKGIMGKLVPSLSLTNDQTPKVTDAVSGYLTGKSKILSLAQTDKTAYTEKQSNLFGTLKTKLAGILL